MSTDTARPGDPYLEIARELGLLGRRLDGMGAELQRLRASGPAAASGPVAGSAPGSRTEDARTPGPVAPSLPTGPAAPVPPHPGWTSAPFAQRGGTSGPFVGPGHAPGGGPAAGWAAAPPAPPRALRLPSLSGARLLAWTGAATTLLGVVLLLVLAASRGWFTPPARIAAGAVLGVALLALAVRLHRRETARVGALALAATGSATLHLVVVAATSLYGYLDAVPALLLVSVVAAVGLALADRWRSELLAAASVGAAAALSPALADGWLLVAAAVVLQVAALPVVLRRRWVVLLLASAAGPVLHGLALALAEGRDGAPLPTGALVATLVVGLVSAGVLARALPGEQVAVLVATAPLPLVVAGTLLGGTPGGLLVLAAAAGLGLLAALPGDRVVRLTAGAAAAVALFQATAVALEGSTGTLVVLGEALVAAVLAAVLRSRPAYVVALAFGAYGALVAIGRDAPLVDLVRFSTDTDGPAPAVRLGVSALVLVVAVALLVAGGRCGWVRSDAHAAPLWVLIGLAGLYGATSLVVTAALLVSPDRDGFTAGHAVVTVSWTLAALVLLARGVTRTALRVTGLVLVSAAVAKLVLFDLVALDGLVRAATFLGAGLLLLAAGTRYARLVAEAARPAGELPAGPPVPGPTGPHAPAGPTGRDAGAVAGGSPQDG